MARIPKDVKTALRMLNEKGYSAYVVGGAVRDYIMGKPPHDWDIATSATPEQMKEVFPRTYDSGIKHGTITAQMPGGDYEITTYRSDGEYSDGRHPDAVSFVSSIEEDLARRDFTINAMAMDVDGKIIDPFGGQKDIQDGVIRCVGNPNDRFHEDALRMMRAVRFESKLGFELDEDTKNAISVNAENLKNVSAERIRDEFTKMLAGVLPKKAFLDAYETGITAQVLPEFDRMMEQKQDCPWHYANVGIHTLDAVTEVDADNVKVRWAALLHDVGKPDCASKKPDGSDTFVGHPEKSAEIANNVLLRLRFSNNDRNDIVKLVSLHEDEKHSDAHIRALGAELGKDMAKDLISLKMADMSAHTYACKLKHGPAKQVFCEKLMQFIEDGTAINIKDLKINGDVLKGLGLDGKAIGNFLNTARNDCLGQPELNDPDTLLKRAQKYVEKREVRRQAAEAAAALRKGKSSDGLSIV